mgnify:CR=1 FL=1|jgi:hypothetical protein
MVGGCARRVKAAALVLLVAAGCAGRADVRQALTHAGLLTALARKGADLVASGRLTAESMPELTYPLERAQAFAGATAAGAGAARPPWLTPFEALVGRYRDFVDALDRVRREEGGTAARAALAGPLAAVEAAADVLRAALPDPPPR